MKRSGLRSRPKRHPTIERILARDFRRATVKGYCAAGCGMAATDAHHVVYEQELRKRGLPRWDARDGLPVCRTCHEAHHNGSKRLPLHLLPTVSLEFAFEQLGAYAYDYLRRRYSGDDERLETFLDLCQEAA